MGVHHRERFVLAADQLEGDHRPTAIHLPLGKVVLRVRLEPGIDHARDLRVTLQHMRQL